MARPRQSIAVIEAKGRSHLSKETIRQRRASEIKPVMDNIIAPDILNKREKTKFNHIADQLKTLGIMGETDVDALARYVIAESFYIHVTKQLRKRDVMKDPKVYDTWLRIQDKYFKQCRLSASDLGLTISSRCRLVIPKPEETLQRENKFARFSIK